MSVVGVFMVKEFTFNLNIFVLSFFTFFSADNHNFFILSMAILSLQYISKFCVSLCHLNIKGCICVTNIGI